MSVCRWCGRTACSEHSDLERRLAAYWSGRVFHDAVRAPGLPTPPQAVRLPAACSTDDSIQTARPSK